MKSFCAVILAAGISRRLGFNKLTLRIDGTSVIKRAVMPFFGAGIDKVCIVTGPQSEEIRKDLKGCHVEFVENSDHLLGMSSSVRAAVPFAGEADGVFFHLGDKPFLKEETILFMMKLYGEEEGKIIVPIYEGMKGHPVLMDIKRYIADIQGMSGDVGLREIIEKNSQDMIFIKGDEDALFDIDTLDDVEILKSRGYQIEKG